ncbi:MAG: hypothetical protein J6X62_02100 [Bacteroidales bacterium]|nr:hypothetical protein [Bacteroidales bacterium]
MKKQHFKRYFTAMAVVTLLLLVISVAAMWKLNSEGHLFFFMPVSVVYFCVITSLLHVVIVNSCFKDPRSFVKNFLLLSVGYLLLNLFVILIFIFNHMKDVHAAKYFTVTFLILYLAYLVLETVSLSLFVTRQRREAQQKLAEEASAEEKPAAAIE